MKRVAHAPSLSAAALGEGVDMLELDVLPERLDGTGRLFAAHDYADLRRLREAGELLTLDEALEVLAGAGRELNVDLKLPGYEDRVVAALRERGLAERVLVSTMERSSLRRIRALDPGLRLGWSVPRLRRNPLESKLTVAPAYAGMLALRRALPSLAARAIRQGRCDALMVHHRLVTPRLVRWVLRAGGEVYVWTVEEPGHVEALRALGVTGVIADDVGLFQPLSMQVPAE